MKPYSIRALLLFVGLSGLLHMGVARAQTQSQSTSSGNTERFTISLTNTHGVSSSAQMTPDFDVKTTAKMIIGPGSTSSQTNADGALAVLEPGRGASQGVSGFTQVNFGEGTQYEVTITPRALADGEKRTFLGTASGSASGSTSTSLTIDSTQSAFVNTLIQNFQ